MATSLNNEAINAIAQKWAETRSDDTFAQYYSELKPMIHNEAAKAERDFGIPRETMISLYSEAVWQAARGDAIKDFDGSSNITQRVHEFFKRRLADEIKYVAAAKRKGSLESLDKLLPDSKEPISYGETIPAPYSVEHDLTEAEWIREALEGFRKSSERFGMVIEMILHGNTREEIAASLGSPAYTNQVRQIVKRARASFRAYLDERKTLDQSG